MNNAFCKVIINGIELVYTCFKGIILIAQSIGSIKKELERLVEVGRINGMKNAEKSGNELGWFCDALMIRTGVINYEDGTMWLLPCYGRTEYENRAIIFAMKCSKEQMDKLYESKYVKAKNNGSIMIDISDLEMFINETKMLSDGETYENITSILLRYLKYASTTVAFHKTC